MCGIVGIFDPSGSGQIDRDLLHRMNESQFHRGPDEGGVHIEPGVGLAHRRLSIIDLSSGQQPLFNEDGSVIVTYNGEIYNFQELMQELKAAGHVFKTHCDTEVIVHAWEEWGETCVNRFRGMFAFAIWDRNKETLFLARDRLGIKPLYYAQLSNNRTVFSSELKALYLHPDLDRTFDDLAIEDYFAFGYIPDPRTILKQVKKLPPGHTLTFHRRKPVAEPKEYWDVPFLAETAANEEHISEELVERLEEAVKIRMVAEVPLGAFLSGGVDSSAVVALMAKQSQSPVNTCSIGFGDPKFNETEYADMVAERYATNHHLDHVDTNDYDLIDKLASLYDEPYADSSAIPTYRVCELAKRQVTVALSGDGGDENFAGYRRHRWHMLEEKVRGPLPGLIRRPLFGALGRYYPKLDWAPKVLRAKTTFQAIARDSFSAYLNSVSVIPDEQRSKLFSDSFNKRLNGYRAIEVFKQHAERSPTDHPLSMIQYLDMKTYLPSDILTKVDRASMAHALEVRVPILDHKFVEWVSGIGAEYKLRGREGKYIFKKSLEGYLPSDVLYRPKMGFGVPISSWFRKELKQRVRDSILSERLLETGLFNRDYLKRLVDEHQSGMKEHSAALWSLLMFDSFLRNLDRA
ncbi:MAG: XrtA/PEP-CTERM system amidotransferase [Sedimenticola sp.]